MSQILIIGAGPGGAMLAYLLASRGIQVTLIERQRDFAREFRGEVLMPSGVDVFRQAGLDGAFQSLPIRALRRIRMFDRRRLVGSADLAQLLGADVSFQAVSQPAMLEMLVHEASKFATFRFQRGAVARELIIERDRVRGVEVSGESHHQSLLADLVIGADGRASSVRRKAGLELVRRPQEFDIVWCKAPLPPPEIAYDGASLYLGDRHFALAFPTYDDTLQIAWVIQKGAIGELRQRGIEQWIDEMADHVSPDFGAHLRANLDRITHPFLLDVICDLMPRWTRPGLLLLGDAAHPMSPVGGQGINIAMRDALVAANHLVAAIRSGGDRAALDEAAIATQHERMREVSEIQRLQQLQPRVLFRSAAVTRTILFALPLLIATGIGPGIARSVFRRFAYGVSPVHLQI